MKEIKAIIQPFRLSKVVSALQAIPGLPGVTVFDVRGFGRQRGAGSPDAFEENAAFYVKKTQVEVVVPDHMAEEIVQTIQKSAFTGNPGDGKIFVRTVDDVVRISTGERGEKGI